MPTTQTRDRLLTKLLARTITLPSNDDGLLLWHEHDDPTTDSPAKAALRRALSNWRAGTLAVGAGDSAAREVLEAFDAALNAVDELLGDPTDDDRQRLADSLTRPTKESEMK